MPKRQAASSITTMPAPSGKKLTVAAVAERCGIAIPTVYRALATPGSTFPAPFYPSPRCPRWDADEVDAYIASTRQQPRDAAAARRAARLAAPAAA